MFKGLPASGGSRGSGVQWFRGGGLAAEVHIEIKATKWQSLAINHKIDFLCIRVFVAGFSFYFNTFNFFDQFWYNYQRIAHNPQIGNFKNRGIRIFVDGNYFFR
jgi:hypothetical protein